MAQWVSGPEAILVSIMCRSSHAAVPFPFIPFLSSFLPDFCPFTSFCDWEAVLHDPFSGGLWCDKRDKLAMKRFLYSAKGVRVAFSRKNERGKKRT